MVQVNELPNCLQIIAHSLSIHYSGILSVIIKNHYSFSLSLFLSDCNKARDASANNFRDYFLHGKK